MTDVICIILSSDFGGLDIDGLDRHALARIRRDPELAAAVDEADDDAFARRLAVLAPEVAAHDIPSTDLLRVSRLPAGCRFGIIIGNGDGETLVSELDLDQTA
jgi:hypothetical protein